jgi:hypothetical protein
MKEIRSTVKFIKKIKQIKFKSAPGFNTSERIKNKTRFKKRLHCEAKRISYLQIGNMRQIDRPRTRNRRDH